MRGNVSEYRDSEALIAYFFMARQPYGPRPPHYWGFEIALKHTTLGRIPLDECLTTIHCVISQKNAGLSTCFAVEAWNPALILSKTYQCVTYHFNSTGRRLLGVSFITSVKSNFMHKSNPSNSTENNCIISNAQNTTAQPNVCASASGHKQGTVGSPQQKPLPTTANTTASNKYLRCNFTENAQLHKLRDFLSNYSMYLYMWLTIW